MIKSSDPVMYRQHVCVLMVALAFRGLRPCQATSGLSYSLKLCPSLAPPVVLLRHPLLAELFGAGFTKAPGNLVQLPLAFCVLTPSLKVYIYS